MDILEKLEKKINSELTTKINSSKINHNQLCLNIDSNEISFFIEKYRLCVL